VSNGRAPSGGDGGNKLSPQTLIVASLASLTAAIVVSYFWRGGTPIAAAVTPIIVALASELYRRPAERITRLSSRATAVRGANQRERVLTGPPAALPDQAARTEVPDGPGPIRVYRTPSSRRRFHAKVVVATAVVAFAIAAAVLTLPELVFGGSLASHGRTTFFGGSTHHRSKSTQSTSTVTTRSSSSSQSSSSATTTVTVPAPAAPAPKTTTTQSVAPPGATGPTGP
jgi:hypothetical protein